MNSLPASAPSLANGLGGGAGRADEQRVAARRQQGARAGRLHLDVEVAARRAGATAMRARTVPSGEVVTSSPSPRTVALRARRGGGAGEERGEILAARRRDDSGEQQGDDARQTRHGRYLAGRRIDGGLLLAAFAEHRKSAPLD